MFHELKSLKFFLLLSKIIYYRHKVFEEVAQSKLENKTNMNITNFGFKSTPYYEYFSEKYDKALLGFGKINKNWFPLELPRKKYPEMKKKREENQLYKELEERFKYTIPSQSKKIHIKVSFVWFKIYRIIEFMISSFIIYWRRSEELGVQD